MLRTPELMVARPPCVRTTSVKALQGSRMALLAGPGSSRVWSQPGVWEDGCCRVLWELGHRLLLHRSGRLSPTSPSGLEGHPQRRCDCHLSANPVSVGRDASVLLGPWHNRAGSVHLRAGACHHAAALRSAGAQRGSGRGAAEIPTPISMMVLSAAAWPARSQVQGGEVTVRCLERCPWPSERTTSLHVSIDFP